MRQEKLLALGEAHLAFVPKAAHESLKEAELFIKESGGSPINVALAATKLGIHAEFAGKIGDDPFGDTIADLLNKCGVGTRYLSKTNMASTHVFFRSQAGDGERTLVQTASADFFLRPDDIDKEWMNRGDVIYFGSKPLAQNPSRGAIEKAVNVAGEKGAMIVFAPQLRLDEWPNETLAREIILYNAPYAHLLILSEEELKFYTGKEDEYTAIKNLFGGKIKCMIITRGNKGITYVTERDKGNIRYAMKEIVDKTGMDDAFIGYIISDMIKRQVGGDGLSNYLKDVFLLEEVLENALKFREFSARRRGAFASIAEREIMADA
ncbi:MAG: PfkB family carbohydrate kinase [Tuberibacillus sp.]